MGRLSVGATEGRMPGKELPSLPFKLCLQGPEDPNHGCWFPLLCEGAEAGRVGLSLWEKFTICHLYLNK
jgi:hypothetical protein